MEFVERRRPGARHPREDAPTRERVARSILENGPSTAADLAERLDLTAGRRTPPPRPPGRATARSRRATRRSTAHRGRGRPAKVFALTEAGRDQLRPAVRRPRRPGAALPRRDRRATTPSWSSPGAGWRSSSATTQPWSAANPEPDAPPRRWPRCSPTRATPPSVARAAGRSGDAAVPAALPGVPRRPRVPAAVRGRDRGDRRVLGTHVQRLATIAHGDGVCTTCIPDPLADRTCHRRPPEGDVRMTSIEELNPELEGIGRYEFGWSDSDAAGATAQRGLNEDVVRDISGTQERAAVDARPAPQGPQALRHASRCPPGAADLGGIDFDNIKYFVRSTREAGHHLGGPARGHQEHLRPARHPRGGEAAPRLRRRRAVRVRGRLPPDPRGPRGAGRHLPRHRHRAARAPGALPGVLRHRHPGRRQQVRRAQHRGVVGRLVHLRAAGRPRRHPAAGLLPDQHREHGPVRADADHRRRGRLRALRRGLHRADLLLATRCTPRSSRSS